MRWNGKCLKFAQFMSFPGDGDCSWEHVARKTLSYPVMCVVCSQIQPRRSALTTTCLACQYLHVLHIQHCITNTLISRKYASRTHQFIANLVSEVGEIIRRRPAPATARARPHTSAPVTGFILFLFAGAGLSLNRLED